MKGVVKNGGAAGETFFNHVVFIPQGFLQQTGPALVFGKAVGVCFGVFGISAVTVGVGIAKAYDVFFHTHFLLILRFFVAGLCFGQRCRRSALSHAAELLIRQSEMDFLIQSGIVLRQYRLTGFQKKIAAFAGHNTTQ